MLTNPVIESMLNRKSVRKYSDQKPTHEVIATVVRAGLRTPFASQLCSLLLSRKWGQWLPEPKELLDQMETCRFVIGKERVEYRASMWPHR